MRWLRERLSRLRREPKCPACGRYLPEVTGARCECGLTWLVFGELEPAGPETVERFTAEIAKRS